MHLAFVVDVSFDSCPCSGIRVTSVVPVLLQLETPLPFQVLVFVVVGEETADSVSAARHESSGHLLLWSRVTLQPVFRWVTSDHVGHLFHWDSVPIDLLDIPQSRHYLPLDEEVDPDLVRNALFDRERLFLQVLRFT